MPDDILRTLLSVLKDLGTPLTRPGFANFLVVAVGWIRSHGTHAVTEALVVTGVAGEHHHEAFHRFFSRGTWNPDHLGFWLFRRIDRWTGTGALRVAIDDTLAPKKGAHVFGIGSHIDAVRSTKRQRVFCFGHCWVTLAVLLRVPFSSRVWALPVLFRLYRNLKECERHGAAYRKKTELARDMLDVLAGWTDARRVELAADSAYCNDTVTRGLPSRFVLFGAMRPDAVLTALPDASDRPRAGRPSKRGKLLPKPEAIAKDGRRPWKTCTAFVYGRTTTVRYKTFCAQWYRACGIGLLRVVIVATTTGAVPFRVFFCTDATLEVPEIVEGYGARWAIECFFREGKQLLGFADSSARKAEAVLRVAPFVGLLYSALIAWFLEGASLSPLATPPVRPWYRHKRGSSFEDILRAARRALAGFDILVPSRDSEDLRQSPARSRKRGREDLAPAA